SSPFFFSSRRRHTRFSRDWSSDVCSSDLMLGNGVPMGESLTIVSPTAGNKVVSDVLDRARDAIINKGAQLHDHIGQGGVFPPMRSEERRVGKEGRCRSWPVVEQQSEAANE